MTQWLSHRLVGWYVLGSYLGTGSNPSGFFLKGPIFRCNATTPSSFSLTSNRVNTINLLSWTNYPADNGSVRQSGPYPPGGGGEVQVAVDRCPDPPPPHFIFEQCPFYLGFLGFLQTIFFFK